MAQSQVSVLIVEDETLLADSCAEWLDAQYAVRTAYTGESAVAALDEAPPDVILLDRRLLDLSGEAVLDAVEDRGVDCRVVLVSAVEPDLDVFDLGCDLYVEKPVSDVGTLRSAVETLCRRDEYDERMYRYFALASKRGTLEAKKSRSELEEGEAYQELLDELDALSEEVETTMTRLDNDDFRADFHGRRTMQSSPSGAGPEAADASDEDTSPNANVTDTANRPSAEASGAERSTRSPEAERE